MTNLILVHPDDKLNLTKTIIEIDNWRVIGLLPGGKFYLVTQDCNVYHITGLNLKKFNSLIRMGLEMTRKGIFDTIALVCPLCSGTGITDWVTDVVGPKPMSGTFPEFKRDPNLPVYKTKLNHNGKPFTVYFSRAIIPESHDHCKYCKGTGLFIFDYTTTDEGYGIKEYNFR